MHPNDSYCRLPREQEKIAKNGLILLKPTVSAWHADKISEMFRMALPNGHRIGASAPPSTGSAIPCNCSTSASARLRCIARFHGVAPTIAQGSQRRFG